MSRVPLRNLSVKSYQAEEDRIRSAYARRQVGQLYSLFNPGQLFMIQERERLILALLDRHGYSLLEDKTILDVGCGAGFWIREFIKWGARPDRVTGVDLLPDRIAEARRSCPGTVTLSCGSASQLNFSDGAFDLVHQSMVFTSVLDSAMKRVIAAEMLRVVKPNGLIVWYDYHMNNPNNPDVRGVNKREIDQLFSGCRVDLRRVTLAPPLVRVLAPHSWLACYLLGRVPFLCTHYIGIIQKG